MQWLTLVSEDAGVQRLKADNRQPVTARSVDAVAPYPSAHPVRIGEDRVSRQHPVQDRRQDERRNGGDRRKHQSAVLLDTRSQHDRRNIFEDRRHQASAEDTQVKTISRTRINLYA